MNEPVILTPEELRARKRRNVILALSIVGFVALIYLITVARISPGAGP
jgi:hypothetical protein